MILRIPRTFAALILTVLALLLGGLALSVRVLYRDLQASRTVDDVLVISGQVARLYQKTPPPSPAEIDAHIRMLIQTGVIRARVTSEGVPVDAYGTPFRVRHTLQGTLHRATATSAGPDRLFDTADDISRDATWEP
jgi:hypothetical protein